LASKPVSVARFSSGNRMPASCRNSQLNILAVVDGNVQVVEGRQIAWHIERLKVAAGALKAVTAKPNQQAARRD